MRRWARRFRRRHVAEKIFHYWAIDATPDHRASLPTMSKDREHASSPDGLVSSYSHLLSLAAHEFRTPASVVGGYLRMLQKDTDPLTRAAAQDDRRSREVVRAPRGADCRTERYRQAGRRHGAVADSRRSTCFSELDDVAANMHDSNGREVQLQRARGGRWRDDRGDRHRLRDRIRGRFHGFAAGAAGSGRRWWPSAAS